MNKMSKVRFALFLLFLLLPAGFLLAQQSFLEIPKRSSDEQQTIDIYKKAGQGVVFITTITLTVDPFDFFPEVQPREGTGSGILVDAKEGTILTNLHVIRDAHKIEITLANGSSYAARFVGADDEYDIAVLQLKKPFPAFPAIPFGDSSQLEVGQRVLAIGNPFGLDRTLTSGIISSLNRTVKTGKGHLMKGLIQTDAAINPGNSGGPLLDMNGNLIGINTAILSQSGDSAGIGFAVPINSIRPVLRELIATGKVLRPKMGWILVDTTQGPMVRRVLQNSPADQAGVQPIEREVNSAFIRGYIRDFEHADLIIAVNGESVSTRDQVDELISKAKPGAPIKLTLRRGGLNGKQRIVEIVPVLS